MAIKRRNRINEQFSARVVSMLESPAYGVLSRSAHQFLSRLEIELAHHAGHDNGRLPLTYRDLLNFGMTRDQIAPAMREVVALGFAERTRRGSGGNADHRQPSLWRLTYQHAPSSPDPTHEWRRIKTVEEAKALARAARSAKDQRAVAFGNRRKNRNQSRKAGLAPIRETRTETSNLPIQESRTTGSVRNPGPLSKARGGARASEHARASERGAPDPDERKAA